MQKIRNFIVLFTSALVMLSCGLFNLERNADGTVRVETTLPLSVIETAIETSADLSNVVNLELELREGYVFIQADSIEVEGSTITDVSMHLNLSAVNGQLSGRITNVDVSGLPIDESLFEQANEMLAQQLSEASQQSERARLDHASVSPAGIELVWIIDPS